MGLDLWRDIMYCVGVFVTCNVGGAVIRMAKERVSASFSNRRADANGELCESIVTSIIRPIRMGDGALSLAKAEELADKGAWSDSVYDAFLGNGYDEETLKARYDGTLFRRYMRKRAEALITDPEQAHEREQQEFDEIQRQIGYVGAVRKPDDGADA